jgi:hypothetical protein
LRLHDAMEQDHAESPRYFPVRRSKSRQRCDLACVPGASSLGSPPVRAKSCQTANKLDFVIRLVKRTLRKTTKACPAAPAFPAARQFSLAAGSCWLSGVTCTEIVRHVAKGFQDHRVFELSQIRTSLPGKCNRARICVFACKFACNNDPLRGDFRVQFRPL